MALTFPNNSRSYDEAKHRIRFLGYDGMFEVKFFVEVDAVSKAMAREVVGERALLEAFDSVRGDILDVAQQAYSHGRGKTMYVLTPTDFN